MKERPILFSAPMVRALLEGRKTQTRRAINPQPYYEAYGMKFETLKERADIRRSNGGAGNWMWKDCCFGIAPGEKANGLTYPPISHRCPHGQPGDRLWVKETFGVTESAPYADGQSDEEIIYRADGWKDDGGYFKWKPSIFMQRHASRILLEITDVRVERLQEINEADAVAEGSQITDEWTGCAEDLNGSHVKAYRHLWESINGAGSWDANPWAWVINFQRIEPK